MTEREIQRALNGHGFPCGRADGVIGPRTRAAVARYQRAWAGLYGADGPAGAWLAIDGIPGPDTQACLEHLPALSWHFYTHELRSKGNGVCWVDRELVAAFEHLRGIHHRPFRPISAYRDPAHNRAVGGARYSMHLHGLAGDTPLLWTVDEAESLGVFSGIGDKGGRVRHVDLRHLSRHNKTPSATPFSPARWHY